MNRIRSRVCKCEFFCCKTRARWCKGVFFRSKMRACSCKHVGIVAGGFFFLVRQVPALVRHVPGLVRGIPVRVRGNFFTVSMGEML
jgi:hypothetical protein